MSLLSATFQQNKQNMNKKSIITLLVALVSITGQGQVHFRIEGNIGMPDFTGVMEIKDVLKQQSVDTIKVVNGIITPKEGTLPEMAMCLPILLKHLCKQTPFHKRKAN